MSDEYVIKGNAAVLKCNIPSFVSDHVEVIAWVDTNGLEYLRELNTGTERQNCIQLLFSIFFSHFFPKRIFSITFSYMVH